VCGAGTLSAKQKNKSPIQVYSLAHSYSYLREWCKQEGLAYLLHSLPSYEQGFYAEDCTTLSGLGNIISCPDDGGGKSMWSAATLLPDHMAKDPRTQLSSQSPLRLSQTSNKLFYFCVLWFTLIPDYVYEIT